MLVRSVARAAVFTSALFVLMAGCSDKKTGEVSGTVSVDGKPVEKGSISFIPVDGNGTTSGSEIKNGKYTVLNASPGTMKVQIRVPVATGKKKLYDTPDSKTRETFSESLPKKYNDESELKFEVKLGKNEKNWDLSTTAIPQ